VSAIDPRLLGHYNRELSYLRRRAGEFAEDHRQVAGLLGLDAPTDPDPHVERLMEGVAYLNARVRLKMDEQFPVFTQYLLDSLYPHYLATTPAMGIVAITPKDDPGIKAGALHPRGSAIVASLAGDATLPVQFRTGFDVTLWPIKLGGVEYLPTRAAVAAATDGAPGDAALRLRIDATSAATIAEMGIDALTLFFDGGGDTPNLVHQQMLSECVGVRVVAPERGRRSAWIEPAGPVDPVGFGEDEALLPNEARSFRGYRLLAEYFALPEKFRFARLTGLKAGMARAEKAVDIVILFRRSIPSLGSAVSNDTVVLFATPVINLFEKRFDRAIVDKKTHEHIVLPDRAAALDYEVYRLDEVTAFAKGDAVGIPALPLYARRAQRGVRPLFYSLRRKLRRLSEAETRKRRENDYIGSETWISLSSPGEPALASSVTEIGLRGLVSNRALATRLRPGAGALDLSLTDNKGVAKIAILRGPTRPQPPMGMVDGGWRIVSHLAPGHDGFVRDDGAPDLLADHLSLYVRDEAPALRREIQGIVGLTATNVTRRVAGDMRVAFQRGQKLTLQVAMGSYEAASAYLFTSVVARFLAEFATINSFAECEVRADNGLTWGWGAWQGRRPTI
jgi:type VI secretion system protein ImpG